MPQQHGAETIKQWLEDFAELVRSGEGYDISAGANPRRDYAYLEVHQGEEGRHSILLFRVEERDGEPRVHAYRFDGGALEVREKVDGLTHER